MFPCFSPMKSNNKNKMKKEQKKPKKYLDMEQVKEMQEWVDGALDCLMDIHDVLDQIITKKKKPK